MPNTRPVAVLLALGSVLSAAPLAADLEAKRRTLEARVEGLAVGGSQVALASSGGLVIVDAAEPGSPRRLGALPLAGGSGAVALDGSRAYVACAAEGLAVAGLENPEAPVELGRLDTDGGVVDVLVVRPGLALLADGTLGLKLADLSDPARPAILAELETGGYARGLAPHPLGALVAAGEGGLLLVGIADDALSVKARLDGADARAAWALDERRILLADGRDGLALLELDGAGLSVLARIVPEPGEVRDVVLIQDQHAALAMGRGGLRVVQVRDDRLREVGGLSLTRPAVELALAGRTLFVANDSGGLAAVDVSRPDRPRLLTPSPGP